MHAHYLILSIEPMDDDNVLKDKSFNISKLKGYESGRQSAKPFVTTVEELMQNIVP